MATVVQNLVHSVLKDGARSAKFEVNIHMPQSFYKDERSIAVLAKSSSFPGKNHELVDVKFRGRSIPVKGQVKYTQTWDCTFYMTEDHMLKSAFEDWMDYLDQRHNYKPSNEFMGLNYTGTIHIDQLNFDLDAQTTKYSIYNVFPIAVTQVDTDYTAVGSILEFTVTFAYTHFETNAQKKEKNIIDQIVDLGKNKIEQEIDDLKEKVTSTLEGYLKEKITALDNAFGITEELTKMKQRLE